jgi:hypothetical protein
LGAEKTRSRVYYFSDDEKSLTRRPVSLVDLYQYQSGSIQELAIPQDLPYRFRLVH